MSKDLLRYSMQVAMLKKLLSLELITRDEYYAIKRDLMQDYHVIADFVS